MKKRFLITITSLIFTTGLLSACGTKPGTTTIQGSLPTLETTTAQPVTTTTSDEETTEEETTTLADSIPEYSYNNFSQTMYAISNVNVRTLPATIGDRLGQLVAGQQIEITGQCVETQWYRITFNGSVAYVSNSYLSTEAPTPAPTEEQTPEPAPTPDPAAPSEEPSTTLADAPTP